jgi:hypothetical protein
MASPAQVTANFANAQKSTGPRTEAGKIASSRNAMTHGIYSKASLIPGESEAEYQSFRCRVITDLSPATEIEFTMAEDIADIQWRICRLRRFEDREMQCEEVDVKRLNTVITIRSRMRRDLVSTLRSLHQIQQDRRKHEAQQLPAAMTIRRADRLTQRQTDFRKIGFDLSAEFIDEQIARQDALRYAEMTLKKVTPARAA